ncbi:MAG: response regulator [Fibrobacter sp.]|nr:response regulator [Fibrobacter sp.]
MKKTPTILLIDDLPFIRDCIITILEERDVKILEAENAASALVIFNNTTIDLVLTDMVMPGNHGIDLIVELKKIKPEIKIIAMSGAANKENSLELAKSLGAHAILCKPFKKEELLRILDNTLGIGGNN